MWNFAGLQARGYLILNDHLLLFDNWKNYNHVLKKKSNDTSLLSKVFNLQKRKMVFNYLFIFNGWPRPRHWERPKNVLCLGHLVLSLGKIHPVGVCFLTLTAGGTHQLWDPPAVSGRKYTPVTGYTSSFLWPSAPFVCGMIIKVGKEKNWTLLILMGSLIFCA